MKIKRPTTSVRIYVADLPKYRDGAWRNKMQSPDYLRYLIGLDIKPFKTPRGAK